MYLNGARRCPVCKRPPLHFVDSSTATRKLLQIIECPGHGYIGAGYTLDEAVQTYNSLVDHYVNSTTLQTVFDEPTKTSSPCLWCKKNTEGKTVNLPERYYVQCEVCNLVKHEGAPL